MIQFIEDSSHIAILIESIVLFNNFRKKKRCFPMWRGINI